MMPTPSGVTVVKSSMAPVPRVSDSWLDSGRYVTLVIRANSSNFSHSITTNRPTSAESEATSERIIRAVVCATSEIIPMQRFESKGFTGGFLDIEMHLLIDRRGGGLRDRNHSCDLTRLFCRGARADQVSIDERGSRPFNSRHRSNPACEVTPLTPGSLTQPAIERGLKGFTEHLTHLHTANPIQSTPIKGLSSTLYNW